MNENESEKTVRLTPGQTPLPPAAAAPATPPIPPASPLPAKPAPPVPLTPADEKTQKLSSFPPPPASILSTPKKAESTVQQPPLGNPAGGPPRFPIPPVANTPTTAASATIPAPQRPQTAAAPVPPPVQIPPEPEHAKFPAAKLGIVVVLLLGLAGVGWFFAPGMLQKMASEKAKNGDHAGAAQVLRWALQLKVPNPAPITAELGHELRIAGKLQEALTVLEPFAQKNPQTSSWKDLALIYSDMGQKDKALDACEKTLAQNPGDLEILKRAAEIAFDLKKFDASVRHHEALQKAGQAGALELKKLGVSYFETKQFDKSEAALKSALEKDMALSGVQSVLAKISLEKGDFAAAAAAFKAEMSFFPQDHALAEGYAQALQKQSEKLISDKKIKEAATVLEEGLSVKSSFEAIFHYQLARLYTAMHKNAKALEHLAKATAIDEQLKAEAKKDKSLAPLQKSPKFQKAIR